MKPFDFTYKRLLISCLGLLFATVNLINADTQHFQYTSNTGNNATIILPSALQPEVDGEPLVPGDEIGVFTEDGLCVGATVWRETTQSITIWGNDEQTAEKDGMEHNDSIYYRVWRQATDIEYKNIEVTYDDSQVFYRIDGRYRIDAIYSLSSLQSFPAPPAPNLISPEDGTESLQRTVELHWGETVRTNSYNLQVATDEDFSNLIVDEEELTSTSYEVTNLEFRTTYYWRASGTNLAGRGEWSEGWNFSTLDVPDPPALVSPEDDDENLPTTLEFHWNETEETDHYTLQIATDAGFSGTVVDVEEITETSYEVTGLEYETTYYWRVSGSNAAGRGEWSDVWQFATLDVPTAPELVLPEDGADNVPVNFEFQWSETERTDHYTLQIATDTDFSNIVINVSEIASTSYQVNGLEYETTYYWRVSGTNAAGQGAWSEVWQFFTPDIFIRITKPNSSTFWKVDDTETIEWQERGVDEITIEYSVNDASDWEVIEESYDASAGSYEWTLPATPSIETQLRLTSNQDENVNAVSPRFTIYPRQIPLGHSLNFGDPGEMTSYRMVGLPGDNDVSLASVMGGNAGSDWTAFHDDGSDEDYLIEYNGSDTFNFRPGRGYWILSRNGFNYDSEADAVELNSGNAFDIPLHTGWNIISNPFELPVSWDEVTAQNDITQPIWAYSGSFNQQDIMEPFQGYYLYNDEELESLSIPYPVGGGTPKRAPGHPAIAQQLTISVEKDDITFSDIAVGIAEEYNEQLERHTVYAPPPDFEKASIRLSDGRVHTEYKNPSNDGYTIEFTVSMPADEAFTLHFEGTDSFVDQQIKLVNKNSGKIIKPVSNNNYTISSETGKEQYQLLIGTEEYVQDKGSTLIPAELTLSQNYPNPFNPVTTIEYSIPQEKGNAFVTLEVYNTLGQRVRTLVATRQPAGFYTVQWDAQNDTDQTVPSGLYIYRLQAGTTIFTKRMIYLK